MKKIVIFISVICTLCQVIASVAADTKPGKDFVDAKTGMKFVFVKGGCYPMGSDVSDSEKPVHEVCVRDFYLGKYEVTQDQWKKIMGNNPSHFSDCGPDCPVEKVSWKDTQDFIARLKKKTGKSYRLPTEAEWEYAARNKGSNEKWAGTSDETKLGEYAWYEANSSEATHKVGLKKPNALGLHDMSGNVSEWCQDWYSEDYYRNSPKDNPAGPEKGEMRTLRGGPYGNAAIHVRGSNRDMNEPDYTDPYVGFRLMLPAN